MHASYIAGQLQVRYLGSLFFEILEKYTGFRHDHHHLALHEPTLELVARRNPDGNVHIFQDVREDGDLVKTHSRQITRSQLVPYQRVHVDAQ